jgi:hypothetical protein
MNQTRAVPAGHAEPHGGGMATRLNWLRAAVLGANDGIVSTAGLVVGVAGATSSRTAILTAGLAGLSAGALAMASGEYVSASSQRDAERACSRWSGANWPNHRRRRWPSWRRSTSPKACRRTCPGTSPSN